MPCVSIEVVIIVQYPLSSSSLVLHDVETSNFVVNPPHMSLRLTISYPSSSSSDCSVKLRWPIIGMIVPLVPSQASSIWLLYNALLYDAELSPSVLLLIILDVI